MNIVLLQSKVSEEEFSKLFKEFPQVLFLQFSESAFKNLSIEDWARIEIIYGNRLTKEELSKAHQLRWVHSPTPQLSTLCLSEIEKQGNILLTIAEEENISQIGEFIMGGLLAFSKNLFHWQEINHTPDLVWDSKYRESMHTLLGKTLLQVGLSDVGSEIARRAKQLDMKVIGISQKISFHPHCNEVHSFDNLLHLLPKGDVVSIALPRGKQLKKLIRFEEFNAMKEGAIVSIVGMKTVIDEEALIHFQEKEKFRGILFDAYYQIPISSSSKLWDLPNVLITPEVSPRPKAVATESFRDFRYNLRQYLHGNFGDMRHLVQF